MLQVEGDSGQFLARERRRSTGHGMPRILLGSRCSSDWDLIEFEVCQCAPRVWINETNEEGFVKDTCQTSWSRGAKCGRLLSAHTLKTEKNKSNIKTGSHTFAIIKHHTSLNVLLSRNFEFRDYRVHVSTYNGTENSVSLTMIASILSQMQQVHISRFTRQEGRSKKEEVILSR